MEKETDGQITQVPEIADDLWDDRFVASSVSDDLGEIGTGTYSKSGTPLTQPRSADVHGYVYFMRSGDAIKIGFSIQPLKRTDELQIGNPEELELLGTFKGTIRDERSLHDDFSHLEIRREWFRAEQELLEFIEEVSGRFIERDLRPRVTPATMATINNLLKRRRAAGPDTALGHRFSNLAEQIRHLEYAEGEQREGLLKNMAVQIADIERLGSPI